MLVTLLLSVATAGGAKGASKDSFVLSISVTGPGDVKSADGRIACPGTCTANNEQQSSVELTDSQSAG